MCKKCKNAEELQNGLCAMCIGIEAKERQGEVKKFRVSFYYEMTGSIEVEAKSQKQAEKKLYNDLNYYGLSDLHKINKNEIDNTSREWDIL
jgi:hypothetical protein